MKRSAIRPSALTKMKISEFQKAEKERKSAKIHFSFEFKVIINSI